MSTRMTKEEREEKIRRRKEKSLKNHHERIDNLPCSKERKMVMKCLNDSGYDRPKCEIYFENYRNCKSFWNKISWERWWKGVTPSMPPPEERDAIQEQYEQEGKFKF